MPVEYLNIPETAEYAGVTRATIYRWLLKGVPFRGERLHLTAVLIAGQYRVNQIDLDRFLDWLGYEPEKEDGPGESASSEA
ncbi:hypothetical protein ES703_97229 [subsurface metagenome]